MSQIEDKAVWRVEAAPPAEAVVPGWLSEALSGSGVIVAVADRELRCTWVSQPGAGGGDEPSRLSLADLLPGASEVARLAREAMASGRTVHGAVVSPSGEGGAARHYDVSVRPLPGTGVAMVAQDVTERVTAQRALAQSEERFRVALSSGDVYAYEQDRELRYTWLYPAQSPSGRTVLGRRDSEMIPPEDAAPLEALKRRAMETGQVQRERVRATLQGVERWYDLIVEPRYDHDGQVVGVGGAALDITARQRAQELAQESEGKYRGLVGSNVLGVMFGDEEGRILDANDEFLRIVGYTRGDLEAGRLNWQVLTPLEEAHKDRAAIAALDSEAPGDAAGAMRHAPFEKQYIRKDGTRAPVMVGVAREGRARRGGAGGQLGWFVIDVSARRRAEDALMRQAAELARSNAELEHFAHITAHDLKEPLRGIRLNAGFLIEDCRDRLSGDDLRHLDALDRLCRRMHDLLEAMLYYSLVGQRELQLGVEDLGDLAAAAVEQLQARLRESDAVVEIQGPLPRVACDRSLVTQVIANLVSNGVKYNTSTPRKVWICAGGDGRSVAVRDNGIGVRPDQRERIFQMFKRLHERDAFGGGTGAGLAIVKRIVERHGGRVWVESEPGRGSTFLFTLEPNRGEEVPAGA